MLSGNSWRENTRDGPQKPYPHRIPGVNGIKKWPEMPKNW
jgi:hypothetical protein